MSKEMITKLLSLADININGKRKGDIQVHDEKLFNRVLSQGSMGLGDSYMDGWWDCDALDIFFAKVLGAELDKKVRPLKVALHYVKSSILNLQTKTKSKEVAEQHYDLGNDFYQDMLGSTMQYTCAYFDKSTSLDQAQINKMDLVCKKMGLKPGMTVLELGCGWGEFAIFAAKNYKVKVDAYNISKEQVAYAKIKAGKLPITFHLKDYREAQGSYDRVISVGMAEHVGPKNYKGFLALIDRCLKPGGLVMIHTIGSLKSQYASDPWIEKYIFPNGVLPSIAQLSTAAEPYFVVEDIHNFGADYDKTLMAWYANFIKAWPKYKARFGDRFFRMWSYYLLSCAGGFRCRKLQLWQIVLSKGGVPGGYKTVR